MADFGPIPKRSDQLIRRNATDPAEKVTAIGPVDIPTLSWGDPVTELHPLVRDFWDSLKISAQNKFYEPSDWQTARIALWLLDDQLKSGKPSAVMIAEINRMFSALNVTEGDRRRVRIEVERQLGAPGGAQVLEIADLFRQRLAQDKVGG